MEGGGKGWIISGWCTVIGCIMGGCYQRVCPPLESSKGGRILYKQWGGYCQRVLLDGGGIMLLGVKMKLSDGPLSEVVLSEGLSEGF